VVVLALQADPQNQAPGKPMDFVQRSPCVLLLLYLLPLSVFALHFVAEPSVLHCNMKYPKSM
jgi:hypothetical protein